VASLKQRILDEIKKYPEGIDDDQLAKALGLSQRQTANQYCRRMEQEGLIIRKNILGKIRNLLSRENQLSPSSENRLNQVSGQIDIWHWEGSVQAKVKAYLESQGYSILSTADTSTKEKGRDIEAIKEGRHLWITVKGYPVSTVKTPASVQAGHWFKDAIFDLLIWYGEDRSVALGLALPAFARYQKLYDKVSWLQGTIGFLIFWVQEDGLVTLSQASKY
jgi:hypothetical protein